MQIFSCYHTKRGKFPSESFIFLLIAFYSLQSRWSVLQFEIRILNIFNLKCWLLNNIFKLHSVDDRMILNDELKITWKEEAVAYFTVWFTMPPLAWRNRRNQRQTSLRIVGLRIEIRTRDRPSLYVKKANHLTATFGHFSYYLGHDHIHSNRYLVTIQRHVCISFNSSQQKQKVAHKSEDGDSMSPQNLAHSQNTATTQKTTMYEPDRISLTE
jgi:hypothetical protein